MGEKYEFSLQPFVDTAIRSGLYELASELADQEASNSARVVRLERLRIDLANQTLLGSGVLPRNMDCVDKRSLAFGE